MSRRRRRRRAANYSPPLQQPPARPPARPLARSLARLYIERQQRRQHTTPRIFSQIGERSWRRRRRPNRSLTDAVGSGLVIVGFRLFSRSPPRAARLLGLLAFLTTRSLARWLVDDAPPMPAGNGKRARARVRASSSRLRRALIFYSNANLRAHLAAAPQNLADASHRLSCSLRKTRPQNIFSLSLFPNLLRSSTRRARERVFVERTLAKKAAQKLSSRVFAEESGVAHVYSCQARKVFVVVFRVAAAIC